MTTQYIGQKPARMLLLCVELCAVHMKYVAMCICIQLLWLSIGSNANNDGELMQYICYFFSVFVIVFPFYVKNYGAVSIPCECVCVFVCAESKKKKKNSRLCSLFIPFSSFLLCIIPLASARSSFRFLWHYISS